MTITDFLLARIAEDEAALRHGYDVRATFESLARHTLNEREPGWLGRTPAHIAAHMREVSTNATALDAADRTRRLAECEAKRRIVELADEATGFDMTVDQEFRIGSRDERQEPYIGDVMLRTLAAVYADHPDYDEAWRP